MLTAGLPPITIEIYTLFGGFMDPLAGIVGARRNEDIALDLMKFIAATTNFGKTVVSGAGFHGASGEQI